MDYSVAAPKLLCGQLQNATQTSENTYSIGGILFQRAWLQGILVSTPTTHSSARFLLDDGSGLIELSGDIRNRAFDAGAYLMVIGLYMATQHHLPIIKVHKVVDLSMFPDREAMWYLEVIEAFKLFYQPIVGRENAEQAYVKYLHGDIM